MHNRKLYLLNYTEQNVTQPRDRAEFSKNKQILRNQYTLWALAQQLVDTESTGHSNVML